jgi:type IV pilus assembly protein PilY1
MNSLKRFFIVALGLLPAALMQADDTDIYFKTGGPSLGNNDPLVMLSLDFRPSLANTFCTSGPDCEAQAGKEIADKIAVFVPIGDTATTFDALRAVYAVVFEPLDGIKVGMMINHNNSCNGGTTSGPLLTGCSNGGYMFSGFKEFVAGDTNGNKADLLTRMNALPVPQGNTAHKFQGKELYHEFFRYLTGGDVYNGHLGYEDFDDTDSTTNLDVDFPTASWDKTIENIAGTSYVNPIINVNSCTKLSAINLLFQVSQQDSDSDDVIKSDLGLGGNKITFPDVIRAMNQYNFSSDSNANQTLTSYFISQFVNTTTNGYADAGGTSNAIDWADDAAGLQALKLDLANIFNEIISVSTTFVSASVPVSVFNRAEINENLFVAVFVVDKVGKPLWSGNLKKLNLLQTVDIDGNEDITIVDAKGDPAFDPGSGRIRYSALTYWTETNKLDPLPTSPVGEEVFMVGNADGRFVERGGAGQQIPGFKQNDGSPDSVNLTNAGGDRKLYTEDTASGNFLDLDANNATASGPFMIADLGAADVNDAEDILLWARGNDKATGDARSWLIADILHSKPQPVNYGARGSFTQGNPDIRILMGTNDGFMHMFQNTNSNGSQSGVENWAFIPRAALAGLKRLKENTAGAPLHPYGIDGAATVYSNDQNGDGTLSGGDEVWAFFGMRRGGNNVYALDISNPDSPSPMWTIEDNTTGFGELAMTFSQPSVINIQYGASSRPALIFGGGYNGGWNATFTARVGKDAGASTDSEGNAIFIVDAETGALIWKAIGGVSTGRSSSTVFTHATMNHSIASQVAVLDSNGDGLHDRAYVGDTGGGVWRIDFPSASSDNRSTEWQAVKMANFTADDRRFFHKPDVVQAHLDGTSFDAVVLGSGNRADPLDTSVDNEFYVIKDTYLSTIPPLGLSPLSESDLGDITNTCLSAGGPCTADLSNGWRLALEADGEKNLSSPVTVSGAVFFTTYVPAGTSLSSCEANEGSGRFYGVSLFNGSAVDNLNILDDGGNTEASTKADRTEILPADGIPGDVVVLDPTWIMPPGSDPQPRGGGKYWKTFWYEKNID